MNKNTGRQVKLTEREMVIPAVSPAVRWRPAPYTLPESFAAFRDGFEQRAREYISTVNADMYNARYFDDVIAAQLELCTKALNAQSVEHRRCIGHIREYQQRSMTELENRRRAAEKRLNRIMEELK